MKERRRAGRLEVAPKSDIADAHIVICARSSVLAIVTSDPLDLRRLDPKTPVIAI